jgi:branched-subunit amino acid transport protein AzlD
MKTSLIKINNNIFVSLYLLISVALILITLTNTFIKPLGIYDEGFSLTNALRILQGEIPHLDYWAAYPPGTSLTLAMAFKFFEPTLLIARLVNLSWTIVILGGCYIFLRQFASIWLSLTTTVITSFWLSAALYPSYSVTPALALIFTALVFFTKGIELNSKKILGIGGLIAGCIVLFRHDFAGYLFLSISLALMMTLITKYADTTKRVSTQNALFFLASFLATTLVLIFMLLSYSGWNHFIQQAIVFPATGMRENRLLAYPGLLDFFVASKGRWLLAWLAPIIIFVGIFNKGIARANQGFCISIATYTLAVMSLLLTLQAHNRLDMPHAAPSMIFALCFLVLLASNKPQFAPKLYRATSLGLIGVLFIYSIFVTTDYRHINYSAIFVCASDHLAQPCMKADKNQIEIVEFINKNYQPTNYVFVGNTRHDKIFINDASLYFLLNKPIPIKWNEMHPGIVTTREVQENIIKNLDEKKVNVIVIAAMPQSNENNASEVSSGVFALDDYIRNHYRKVFSTGNYQVLERDSQFKP